MQITNLNFSNVNGTSRRLKIEPFNLIFGENASGKTGIVEALTIGLLGYLPRLGKRNADTMALCSGNSLISEVFFSDGTMNGLALKRTATGGTGKPKIAHEFPPVTLDFNEFKRLGSTERVRYLFSRTGGLFHVEQVLAEIKKVKLEQHTTETEQEINNLCEIVREAGARASDVASGFSTVIEKIKQFQSDAEAEKKQGQGALEELIAREAQNPGRPCRPGIDALLAEVNRNRDEAIRQIVKLEAELTTFTETPEQVAELFETLKEPDPTDEIKEKTLKLQELVAKKHELIGQSDVSVETHYAIRKAAVATMIETIKTNSVQTEGRKLKLETDLRRGCCPTCGVVSDDWKEKLKAEAKKEIDALEANLKVLTEEKTKLDASLAAAQEAREKEVEREQQLEKVVQEIEDLENSIGERTSLRDEQVRARALQGRNAETVRSEIQTQQSALDGINSQQMAMAEELREGVRQRTIEAQKQEATKKRDSAEIRSMVAKEALKGVLALQEKEVVEKMRSLMNLASRMVESVFDWKLEFRNGEIGYMKDGVWVSEKTLSGSEEYLAFAGFALALSQDAPVKIVVIDELGRLSRSNKSKLAKAMQRLIEEGKVDHFFGIDVEIDNWPAEINAIKA